jgi:DNA-binding NarL/FixJ family response regulator
MIAQHTLFPRCVRCAATLQQVKMRPDNAPQDTIAASRILRVFLADDHAVLRGGLKAVIETQQDMCVVGEAADGEVTVRAVRELQPDVVVMDVSMPKLNGAEATARIVHDCPATRVVVLTAHEDRAHLQLLLSAGAVGYVPKRAAVEDLVRAIRAVAAGSVYLDATLANHDAAPSEDADMAAVPSLSERESEVMRLIAAGHAMKEIASTLDLSVRTVETYKVRAMEKLKFKSRTDIVQYAMQRGWLKHH